jgi:quercetin dioxygenase-like cupin family protein
MKIKQAFILTSIVSSAFLQGYVVAAEHTGSMTAFNEIEWQPLGETPIQFSVLWGDRNQGENGTYLKLPAGLETGSHAHTHSYNGVTLQGIWQHEIDGQWKTLPVGSHVHQPGNAFHNDRCVGPTACVLLIQQDHKSDLLLAE